MEMESLDAFRTTWPGESYKYLRLGGMWYQATKDGFEIPKSGERLLELETAFKLELEKYL